MGKGEQIEMLTEDEMQKTPLGKKASEYMAARKQAKDLKVTIKAISKDVIEEMRKAKKATFTTESGVTFSIREIESEERLVVKG